MLIAVHAWPQSMQAAVDELRSCQAMTVIRVVTPATSNRLLARDLIRTALRETIAMFLDQPVASITLVSRPGQAIEVDSPLARLRVSVSHMPGMSAAAIGRNTAIGLDVMRIEPSAQEMPDWACVARDYLGPQVIACLQGALPTQRQATFVEAWTHFEACLKCLGLALTEWTPALAQRLATCRVMALSLPEDCRGAIAIPGRVAGATIHTRVS
jgi:4'-phosphopantetheinyl transferase